MNIALLSYVLILITNTILMIYLLPQIWLNYKIQSGTGISDGMLLGNLNMAFMGLIFVYTADMPIIYRVMSPIALCAVLILIAQRVYYNDHVRKFLSLLIPNLLILLALIPVAAARPDEMAFVTGWASFAFQIIYQLPQIIKILRTHSTHGFSFSSLSLQTIGYTCELAAALLLGLPWAVIANDIRAIIMYFIFVLLFRKFPNNTGEL